MHRCISIAARAPLHKHYLDRQRPLLTTNCDEPGIAAALTPLQVVVSETIKVDIWSDIACPWCYIGKRKFEQGAAAFAADAGSPEVVVEYHSYQLAPQADAENPLSSAENLAKHLGRTLEEAREMNARVTEAAASVGLEYNLDVQQNTNMGPAHQLLHFAKAHGKQVELKDRLLRAYFTEGRHVGRTAELADLAAEVGIDREAALAALESGDYASNVSADIALAQQYGVQGVPFFVIDGKYGVSGAQEAGTFTEILQQVQNEKNSEVTA